METNLLEIQVMLDDLNLDLETTKGSGRLTEVKGTP